MPNTDSHSRGNLFAAALGAIGGGLFVALATKTIPKIMPRMMEKMASGCPRLQQLDELVQLNRQMVGASTGTNPDGIENREVATPGAIPDQKCKCH